VVTENGRILFNTNTVMTAISNTSNRKNER